MAGFSFFGLKIGITKTEKIKSDSEVFVTDNRDGVLELEMGEHNVSQIDFNQGIQQTSNNIRKYRDIAQIHDVENAITDIVNEAIVTNTDKKVVSLNLDSIDKKVLTKATKDKILEEHKNICNLLDFEKYAQDYFRQWYTDGRSYFHVVVDNAKLNEGIQKIIPLDPRLMQKIRQIKRDGRNGAEVITGIEEYFVYSEQQADPRYRHTNRPIRQDLIKIHTDAIVYIHSGIVDDINNQVISYLHKAIKPINQLQMMKDSVLIYRLARAPERRIFYVDVGSISTDKIQEYMNKTVDKYKSDLVYDPSSGTVKQKNVGMSVAEDYFLPRREGGRGTEIDTLPSGQNLSEIDDLIFFQKEMYKSLHVPMSRIESDNSFGAGKDAEITRDELKFSKFVQGLRNKFDDLFLQLLKRQLLLKNIVSERDWKAIKNDISYNFTEDFYLEEIRKLEIMRDRIELANEVEDHIGNYFSRETVKKDILMQTEAEIAEEKKRMDKEKDTGEAEHFDSTTGGEEVDGEIDTDSPDVSGGEEEEPNKDDDKEDKKPEE